MAKNKTRVPLGKSGQGINNPFAALVAVKPTNTTVVPETPRPAKGAAESTQKGQRKVVVHAERKGHGGKTVTVVAGLPLSQDALRDLAKAMQKALGCGASVEHDKVLLQGDQTERVRAYLRANPPG